AVRTAFTTEAEAEPAPEPGYEWSFRTENGVLELTGEVPDAATRRALEDAARRSLDPPRLVDVHNQLVVTEGEVPEGFVAVAERGIVNVASCDMGVAEFSCQRYSLLCELPQSRAEAVRASASTPLPYGRLGSVQVLANEAVASCEQGLAKVLERSTIQFDTDSDQIDASSGTVLDEVASAAGDCPGTLRIEGHTDNTGDRATNDALSQRRAASVRRALVDRGLPQSRLVAQGYGDRDPVADNRTRTGRSRNRRIEIRVVRASD
ncbi:MAG: OmpA family protein, partial [Myxococcota bacterium]